MIAQGNALGSENRKSPSPEGATQSVAESYVVSPFQGLANTRHSYPGRCPGLVCCAPLGQKDINSQVLRKSLLMVHPDQRAFVSIWVMQAGRQNSWKTRWTPAVGSSRDRTSSWYLQTIPRVCGAKRCDEWGENMPSSPISRMIPE